MSSPKETPRTLDSRLGYHLVRAAMRVRKGCVETLSELDLLPNQHAVLTVLAESGPMSQKQLAERTTVDAGDLVGYLDGLQSSRRISRERDPRDRRYHLVEITREGRELLAVADNALSTTDRRFFGHLSRKHQEQLLAVLGAIATAAPPHVAELS